MVDTSEFSALASRSITWSIIQNWGDRLVTFVVFIVLARVLNPEQFGLASAVSTVLIILWIIAELGFPDAIVQRPDLKHYDANLPFFASLLISVVLMVTIMIFATRIAQLVEIPYLADLLWFSALTIPLGTAARFQEAFFRRNLDFKSLALRLISATLISGAIAIGCALYGMGVWSLIIQSAVFGVVSVVWLWVRPKWIPGLELRYRTFWPLSRFGLNVVASYMMNFGTQRAVEVLVVILHGPSALGLFAVTTRIFNTLVQLFQTALTDPAFVLASRYLDKPAFLAKIYVEATLLCGFVGIAIFSILGSIAPEITNVVLGPQWANADQVLEPLMILGVVQSTQFLTIPFLSALGHPRLVSFLYMARMVSVLTCLSLVHTTSVGVFTATFVVAQVVNYPISFILITRHLRLSWKTFVCRVCAMWITAAIAEAAVIVVRQYPFIYEAAPLTRIVYLSSLFCICYFMTSYITAREQCRQAIHLIERGFRQVTRARG